MSDESEPLDFRGRKWIKVEEAAEYFSVKPKTIHNWISTGKLKSFVIHGSNKGRIRIHVDDLDKIFGKDAVKRNRRR